MNVSDHNGLWRRSNLLVEKENVVPSTRLNLQNSACSVHNPPILHITSSIRDQISVQKSIETRKKLSENVETSKYKDMPAKQEPASLSNHRIIRFGETANDVFMVDKVDQKRSELVEKLQKDPTCPERWLQLLKCPPSFPVNLLHHVRLYRRATNIISKEDHRMNASYAEIWIRFAKLKENEQDARELFKFMKSERIGEKHAVFYKAFAEFEAAHGKMGAAREIVKTGERMGVFPNQTAATLLAQLGRDDSNAKTAIPSSPEVLSNNTIAFGDSVSTPFSNQREAIRNVHSMSKVSRDQEVRRRASLKTPIVPSKPLLPLSSGKLSLGPARRVPSTDNDSQGIDEDEPDPETNSDYGVKNENQGKLSPITEKFKVSKGMCSPGTINIDVDYIKNWNPSRPLKRQERDSVVTPEKPSRTSPYRKRTITNKGTRTDRPPAPPEPVTTKSIVADDIATRVKPSKLLGSPTLHPTSTAAHHNGGSMTGKSSLSPHSVTSSTASSPPTALMDTEVPHHSGTQDPFAALMQSRIVVNGTPYIKLEQIGSGGSSKVYRILGPDLKIYALKKIKLKRLDALGMEQYHNEIELLKRLQGNPHIIKLVAAEQDLPRRVIYVVMEHGEIDLSEKLRQLQGSSGLEENFLRISWMQMLQAVHAIHRERIIHGDLKPANFLFVNGALKLIDFGIAKAISNDTTNIERDSQVGTVNFMSPEAIQGITPSYHGAKLPNGKMKVGRASDIWSLGCILYQIVYGKPPFADVPSIIEKFRCIVDPLYEIRFEPLVNKHLEHVIRSCLQRDHRNRPPIDGPNGLLNHPFLKCPSATAAFQVDGENAEQVLRQVEELIAKECNEKESPYRYERIVSSIAFLQREIQRGRNENEEFTGHRVGKAESDSKFNYDTQERQSEL